ncbi:MAG TPA: NAD(P)/FAD-dependent oxidoreductase [Quisquiliibacterium sp.]|nr:NAD(P)/FAD-dependent oxidoreductase [Quisquiliibacterium sp.]
MTTSTEFDAARLERALAQADLRVLLMVVFHLTGDERWLNPPYRPVRDTTLIADPNAGLDAAVGAEIRAAAQAALLAGRPPAVRDPGDALMNRMMRVCLNERVPEEYSGMMREEVGFCPRFTTWSDPEAARAKIAQRPFRVGVVGAGAAGIILATHLRRLGIDFVVFEQGADVGGTWRAHRYPGCSVDTPNHAYSFSFGTRYPWSRYFAPRAQIQDYMERIADETGIRPHIRFSTTVERATWDDAARRWQVQVRDAAGVRVESVNVFISAIGQLSDPYRMPIAGEDTFPGPLFHPMHWPADLDVAGKRVALIGTGATAMQIVPEIAPAVAQLTIYQRTPQWARPIPRYHDPIDEDQQWLLSSVPFYAEWFRLTMLWRYGDGLLPTLRKDPAWPHPTRSVNATNERHRQEMLRYIESELEGRPDLLAKAIPDYPPYGKRILLDAGWYQALRRPNVELVTERVDRIEGDTLVASDGRRRGADVVIVATGYDVNSMTARLNVTGRTGRTLAEVWGRDDPFAYLSAAVPEFPNLFIVYGPNTGLAHGGSAIFMDECVARYVVDFVVRMVEDGLETVEADPEATRAYTARVDAEHEALVWSAPGLASYYRNTKGRVTSANPWRMVDIWSMTRRADPEHYRVTRVADGGTPRGHAATGTRT